MIINKNTNIAIVGATINKEKYGYKVTKDLLNAGYSIYPINPKYKKILNTKAYPSLKELNKEKKIDLVVFIVPPKVTNTVLLTVKDLNIKNVWFQPGSFDEQSINFCKQNNINYVANSCIMVERQKNNLEKNDYFKDIKIVK